MSQVFQQQSQGNFHCLACNHFSKSGMEHSFYCHASLVAMAITPGCNGLQPGLTAMSVVPCSNAFTHHTCYMTSLQSESGLYLDGPHTATWGYSIVCTHTYTYICTQYLVTQGKMSVWLTICLQHVCVETRRPVIEPTHELESASGHYLNFQT